MMLSSCAVAAGRGTRATAAARSMPAHTLYHHQRQHAQRTISSYTPRAARNTRRQKSSIVVPKESPAAAPTTATAAAAAAQSQPTTTSPNPHPTATAAAPSKPFRHDSWTRPTIPIFTDGMLSREFISSSLYQSGQGYFNSSARVFRTSEPESMNFNSIQDRAQYYMKLQNLYNQVDECWLTPVEIFKPYYAQAIARWIIETRRKDLGDDSVPEMINPETEQINATDATANATAAAAAGAAAATTPAAAPTAAAPRSASGKSTKFPPLRILEMGGGNGTCALGILDYLAHHYPDLYADTEYTIVELSEYMIETQRETLKPHMSGVDSHVRLLNMSIIDWRELRSDSTTFIIGLEVLDNMPHDRLKESKSGELQQVHVRQTLNDDTNPIAVSHKYFEQVGPVTDPWILQYGQLWDEFQQLPQTSREVGGSKGRLSLKDVFQSPTSTIGMWYSQHVTSLKQRLQLDRRSIWFPTTCLQFLTVVKWYLPKHHLLLADFSHLPSTVEGQFGPVVASKSQVTKGKTVDHDTYLVEQGTVDIFFPTDFQALHYVYSRVCMGMTQEEVKERNEASKNTKGAIEADVSGTSSASPSSADRFAPVNEPRVLSQHDFMDRYARVSAPHTTTRSGWNPIKQDYVNFHFFLS